MSCVLFACAICTASGIHRDPGNCVLGRAKRHWDNLTAHALEADPAAKQEWKFYSARSGWTFVLRGKRRNLFYLIPSAKRFAVSFVFGEKAVKAAEQSDLPRHVIEMIKESPQYPEGRAVRLEVRTAADVKIARQLLAVKLAN